MGRYIKVTVSADGLFAVAQRSWSIIGMIGHATGSNFVVGTAYTIKSPTEAKDLFGSDSALYNSILLAFSNGATEIIAIPAAVTSETQEAGPHVEDSKNIGTAGSNFIRTTVGGMVNSYTITASQGEIVNCEMEYTAQSSTLSSGAIVALAATTTKPYMFNNILLQIPSGTSITNATTGQQQNLDQIGLYYLLF